MGHLFKIRADYLQWWHLGDNTSVQYTPCVMWDSMFRQFQRNKYHVTVYEMENRRRSSILPAVFFVVLCCLFCRASPLLDLGLFDRPDYGDRRLARNDKPFSPEALEDASRYKSNTLDSLAKSQVLEDQAKRLAKHLGTKDLSALNNPGMWERLHQYITSNWDILSVEGRLALPLVIRYNFCLFIIAQIQAEVAFPFPSMYSVIIPAKVRTVPILKEFLEGLDKFLAFVKKRSKKQLLIRFSIGRTFSSKTDVDFILQIPKLITSDPVKVLRWFVTFDLKAQGFSLDDKK